MPTAVIENNSELLSRVTELQDRLSAVQEELKAILRSAGGLQVTLPELHDEATGRIDVQKVASYMGVPLARLAEALQLNYKAIHRNPSAESAQPPLKPVKRSLEILHEFFHKPETVRVWLNTPHPDLDGHTALELILANNSNAVLRILENAVAGVPV
jgi:hypothetical protein